MRTVRHLVEYVLYWAVSRSIRLLPHRLVGWVGECLGSLVYLGLGGRRRQALFNLWRILDDVEEAERRRIARACFKNAGRVFLESISLARFRAEKLLALFEIEGEENLEEARSMGRGILITSGHWGAFEIGSYWIGLELGKLHILERHQSNPFIHRDVLRLRERTGNELVPRTGSARKILSILRSGGALAVLTDQRVAASAGALVPFLGEAAWTPVGPAGLASIAGSPVVPLLVDSRPGGRYRIRFAPPILPEDRGGEAAVRLTLRLQEGLEEAIRDRPELWMWMHSRWHRCTRRKRPDTIESMRGSAGLGPRVEGPSALLDERLAGFFSEDYLENGRNLILRGGDLERRREVARAVGHELVDRGHPTRLFGAEELCRRLHERAGDSDREMDAIRRLDRYDLLILDEMTVETMKAPGIEILGRLLEHRHGMRSLLLTTGVGLQNLVYGTKNDLLRHQLRHFIDHAGRLPVAELATGSGRS